MKGWAAAVFLALALARGYRRSMPGPAPRAPQPHPDRIPGSLMSLQCPECGERWPPHVPYILCPECPCAWTVGTMLYPLASVDKLHDRRVAAQARREQADQPRQDRARAYQARYREFLDWCAANGRA